MNKRQTKILELLTQNKKVEVTKLSELLGSFTSYNSVKI